MVVMAPFTLQAPAKITSGMIVVGTASGNMAIGIVASDKVTLLATSGSVVVPPSGLARTINLTAPVVLAPGTYYTAVQFDNTTARVAGQQSGITISWPVGPWYATTVSFPMTSPLPAGGSNSWAYGVVWI